MKLLVRRMLPTTVLLRELAVAAALASLGCGGSSYRYVSNEQQGLLAPPHYKLNPAPGEPPPDCPDPQTADTAPLSLRGSHHVRYGCYAQTGYIDLEPGMRLRVTTPIVPEGELLRTDSVSGNVATGLTARTNAAGWETAFYDVRGAAKESPVELKFVSAEQVIEGERTQLDEPLRSKLDSPTEPAHFRLYFLSRRSADDRDITLLASDAPVSGEDIVERCGSEGVTCLEALPGRSISPYVLVKFNGREVAAPLGARLSEILRTEGVSDPGSALARLRVRRQWRGRARDVAFDSKDGAILSLPLNAGDEIRVERR